jgi:hypothetical protein
MLNKQTTKEALFSPNKVGLDLSSTIAPNTILLENALIDSKHEVTARIVYWCAYYGKS